MPRVIFVLLAAVLGMSTPATENAWLFLVDDLHISFVHTGRLRDLLRRAAGELIQDDDRYLLRASGPSAVSLSQLMTADRESIATSIRFMTGNRLKASDIAAAPSREEVAYRANIALDAAEGAVYALTREAAPRQAIVYVGGGYDVEMFPAIEERVKALASRAQENNITIFAIDPRGFGAEISDPPADPVEWERYLISTRRSLSLITDGTGGFVIEKVNEPAEDLKRINAQMR